MLRKLKVIIAIQIASKKKLQQQYSKLTIPLGLSLIQWFFDFQSNKFGSMFSAAVDVHFVINSDICSLFGWLESIILLSSEK